MTYNLKIFCKIFTHRKKQYKTRKYTFTTIFFVDFTFNLLEATHI